MREITFNEGLEDRKRKVGRPLTIASKEDFERGANEYFAWVDANPYIDIDYVGKDATPVERKRRRPYLMGELALWLGLKRLEDLNNYEDRTEFTDIFRACKAKIHANQLSGTTAGHFNPSIVGRLLGLTENVNNMNTTTHAVAPEMMQELANILRRGE